MCIYPQHPQVQLALDYWHSYVPSYYSGRTHGLFIAPLDAAATGDCLVLVVSIETASRNLKDFGRFIIYVFATKRFAALIFGGCPRMNPNVSFLIRYRETKSRIYNDRVYTTQYLVAQG